MIQALIPGRFIEFIPGLQLVSKPLLFIMKSIYHFFFPVLLSLLLLLSCSETTSQQSDIQTKTATIAIAGNAYLTEGNSGNITQNGITGWQDPTSIYSVFVKLHQPAVAEIKLRAKTDTGNSLVSVEIDGQKRSSEITSQSFELVSFGHFELPGNEYIQINLRGIEKNGTDFANITDLVLELPADIALSYVKDNENGRYYWGRRGPSVHLSYETPDNTNLKWFYSELTVPEGKDPAGSFFMANGFGEGYFGIQVNSDSERRVLFSVWSPYQTDNPDEIPEDQRIQLIKKGDDVQTGEFGNEGSGGQSFLRYNWLAGYTYRFLNSVEPDGDGNTVYTAYFYSPQLQEWILIAQFLRPKTNTWYTRPHAFLESFLPQNGFIRRKGFYHNQWAADTDGNWHELPTATFTGDDIAQTGYRLDFDGGIEDQRMFFMENGGFFVGETSLGSKFERTKTEQKPDVDFKGLP